jgi:hypothetical protein
MTAPARPFDRLPKGRGWEYRIHRAAFLAGWFVRRGVNLRERVKGSPQTMAEVDILGISFDASLTEHRLVGECKDRKGNAKEADRVVWLLGLRNVLDATDVLFAKPNLSDGTYIWAKPFDIFLWDEAAVRRVESAFALPENNGFAGSFNLDLCEGPLAALRTKPPDVNLKRAWDYLSGAFWYAPNTARTKRLRAYFRVVMEAAMPSEARDAYVAEGLVALLTCVMNTARDLRRLSPARVATELHNSFASGAANATALREIAARADDYYRDAITKADRSGGRARPALQVPRLADSIAAPPSWLGEYLTLVEAVGARPNSATDALRFADLYLYEALLAGNELPETVMTSFAAPTDELLRIVRTAAYFVRRIWAVDCPLLDWLLIDPGAPGSPASVNDAVHTDNKTERLPVGDPDALLPEPQAPVASERDMPAAPPQGQAEGNGHC